MRHPFRLPVAVLTACAVAACSSTISGVQPTPASTFGPVDRGAILSMHRVATITKAQMTAGLIGTTITELGGAPECDVALYEITYETIGAFGEGANTSEGFFVPEKGCKAPYTLVGYAQGTNTVRAQKITDPTKRNVEPVVIAAIYAAHGDAVAATEYLGLGYSTYPFQPYLVTASEASAVIDSMRASRNAAKRLGIPLANKVLITGYSQGGHAALGTQRVIEAQNAAEFKLIAGAPASGPYALEKTTVEGFSNPGLGAPIYSTYTLTAYNKTYGNIYSDPTTVFKEPYANGIDSLLPVNTYRENAALNGKTLPLQLSALLQPAFVKSFTGDPKNPARLDLAKNDLLKDWKPVAPLWLCGGSHDPVVNYENSELAYRFFKGEGATVKLTDVNAFVPPTLPVGEYHDAVLLFCLTLNRVALLDTAKRTARPAPAAGAGSYALHPGSDIPE
jgi:predicted esterase